MAEAVLLRLKDVVCILPVTVHRELHSRLLVEDGRPAAVVKADGRAGENIEPRAVDPRAPELRVVQVALEADVLVDQAL
eukprot:3045764-Prymnesium_polylepis.3